MLIPSISNFHYNLLRRSRDLHAVKGYSICVVIKCAQALLVVFIETVGLAEDAQDDGDGSQRDSDTDGVKQRAYVGQHNVLWGVLWIASLPVAS